MVLCKALCVYFVPLFILQGKEAREKTQEQSKKKRQGKIKKKRERSKSKEAKTSKEAKAKKQERKTRYKIETPARTPVRDTLKYIFIPKNFFVIFGFGAWARCSTSLRIFLQNLDWVQKTLRLQQKHIPKNFFAFFRFWDKAKKRKS